MEASKELHSEAQWRKWYHLGLQVPIASKAWTIKIRRWVLVIQFFHHLIVTRLGSPFKVWMFTAIIILKDKVYKGYKLHLRNWDCSSSFNNKSNSMALMLDQLTRWRSSKRPMARELEILSSMINHPTLHHWKATRSVMSLPNSRLQRKVVLLLTIRIRQIKMLTSLHHILWD